MSAEALKRLAAKQENEPVARSYGLWKNSGIFSLDEGYTFRTSECPSDTVNSSLSDILETDVPDKYNLTAKCAAGILRRAASGKRAGKLPPELEKALKAVVARGDETVASEPTV